MIGHCELFDGYLDTECMRQFEDIQYHLVRWLPAKHNLEQAMQDRIHQEAGNASARATLMQLAAHPYDMQDEKRCKPRCQGSKPIQSRRKLFLKCQIMAAR